MRLFAFAVRHWGLRPPDFWTLTPCEWRALMEAEAEQQRGLSATQCDSLQKWMKDGTRPTDRAH